MEMGKQLHQSATHKPGFDPNCPRCVEDRKFSLGALPTVNDALKNALEFLEALGYRSGDVHDDLALAIRKIQYAKGGRAILAEESS